MNPVASTWDELAAVAVVGTERHPFTGVDLPGVLADLPDVGHDLLAAATATWAFVQAGRLPADDGPERPQPAPADVRGLLSARAQRALEAILDDRRFRPVLAEWLALAARRGERLPPELVPRLLDTGEAGRAADILAVAGPVAPWLAAGHPEWSWVVPAGDESAGPWDAGRLSVAWERSDDRRLAAFRACRRSDPALAREFAVQAWAEEPTTARAALVAAFATGLNPDDEDFLESRLADRRGDVREAAEALLLRLDGSRLRREMEDEALRLVRVEGRIRPGLAFGPPAGHRPLADLVAVTHLARWPESLGRTPRDLVHLAMRSGATGVIEGWARAATAQQDRAWAADLLAGGARPTPELIGALDPDTADQVVVDQIEKWTIAEAWPLLLAHPRPWSAAVTTSAFGSLERIVASGDVTWVSSSRHAPEVAGLAAAPHDPERADRLIAALGRVPDSRRTAAQAVWGKRLTDLVAVVHFRHAMYQELA
ncbi:MAG TPA: DUF5691 domain-containing protein [Acidimicrobiales bacterium]|nr:DUF5691 domain-containing protein [Acidimicrobiales bacterium]